MITTYKLCNKRVLARIAKTVRNEQGQILVSKSRELMQFAASAANRDLRLDEYTVDTMRSTELRKNKGHMLVIDDLKISDVKAMIVASESEE